MASTLENWQEKDFNSFLKSKKIGVVEFGASWCAGCKLVEPIILDLSKRFKDLTFAKIDVAKNPGLASRMGVMSLPNILFLKNGKVAEQIIGSTVKKAIEEKIKKISK